MADIDVVIPTWNGWEMLERCLVTLANQTAEHTVIVVDNGSSDGTVQRARERFPAVTLVELPENLGFGRAVNRGIEAGSAPFVVLVNNDVELDPDFLERIVAPLRADEGTGSVAGLLVVPGRERVDSYGIEIDRTLSSFARFAGAPYPSTPLDEEHVAGPSGGAAAYRRRALEEVGTFDENLFAYMEDVDLALRLRAAGWSAAGARDAVGVHLGGASFGVRSPWQVETYGTSRAYMLRKYGVLTSGVGRAAWALAMELGVVLVDILSPRGVAAVRGRVRGWTMARGVRASVPAEALNPQIGPREAFRRRFAVLRVET